jgi:WD40 repeat protein
VRCDWLQFGQIFALAIKLLSRVRSDYQAKSLPFERVKAVDEMRSFDSTTIVLFLVLASAGHGQQAEDTKLPEDALIRLGSTRLRHGRSIDLAAVSADGKLLATVAPRTSVRLWDLPSGRDRGLILRTEWKDYISDIVLSSDGKLLAWSSGGYDGVRLVDVRTGRLLHVLHKIEREGTGTSPVSAFDPEGKRLVSWGVDATLRLWDVTSGKELRLWRTTKERPRLAFSPDGKTLAVSGDDGIALYSTNDRTQRFAEITGGNQGGRPYAILAMAFSRDGQRMITGHVNDVLLWDVATARRTGSFRFEGTVIQDAQFSADDKSFVAVAQNGEVSICDVARLKVTRRFKLPVKEEPANPVKWARFTPDGGLLAWVEWNSAVRLTLVADGTELHVGQDLPGWRTACFSPDGKLLATPGNNGPLIWDIASGKVVCRPEEKFSISWLSFTPDGKQLVAAEAVEFNTSQIGVWDVASGERLGGRERTVSIGQAALSPDGKVLAYAQADLHHRWGGRYSGVTLLNLSTWKSVVSSGGPHQDPVTRLSWSPDGSQVAYVADRNHLQVIRARDGKQLYRDELGRAPVWVENLWYSNDGKRLFSLIGFFADGGRDTRLIEHDAARGKLVREQRDPRPGSSESAISRDGRLLAWGTDSGEIHIVDVAGKQPRKSFRDPRGGTTWAVFSPDGKTLATGNQDQTILIWQLAKK